MAAVSAVNNWVVRPGHFNEETARLFSTPRDLKDVIDAVQTGLKWFPYFDVSQSTLDFGQKVRNELGPISGGIAFFSLFSDLNDVRRKISHYFGSDDSDAGRKVFNSAMCAVNSGSESAMFLDTIKIVPLSEGMKSVAAGGYWGAAGLLCAVDFFFQIGQVEHLNEAIKNEKDEKIKAVRQDELGLAYFKIVKNICTVALASIILVSLVFAGVTSCLLFSPVVQLGISTTWFVLHFITYYYASAIDFKKATLAGSGIKA